jgi:hypothetical protein
MPESADAEVTGLVVLEAAPVEVTVSDLEGLVFDGRDLNDIDNYALEPGFTPPIPPEREEWVTGADSDGAVLARPPLAENATASFVVNVSATNRSEVDFLIQLLVQKIQAAKQSDNRGLDLVWTPATRSESLTFKVLSGGITELPVDLDYFYGNVAKVSVALTCLPYGLGETVTVGPITGEGPMIEMEIPSVAGDAPADATLIVADVSSQPRRYFRWGSESRHYDSTDPAPLVIDSDSLIVTGYGGAQGVTSGSYDPNATGNNSVTLSTLGGTPIAVCATAPLEHIGRYRLYARVLCSTGVSIRLAWRIGDGDYNIPPVWTTPPVAGSYCEVDLGEIETSEPAAGTSLWNARLDAVSTVVNGTIAVDYISLTPATDGFGKARPLSSIQPGVVNGRDNFTGTTSGAALNGRTATAGGTWATSGGATDFLFSDSPSAGDENVARSSTVSEAAPGRLAVLGSATFTDMAVSAMLRIEGQNTDATNVGILARYVDNSNFLRAVLQGGSSNSIRIEERIAGTTTTLKTIAVPYSVGTWYRLELIAYGTGKVIAQLRTQTGALINSITASSAAAATGGALDDGKGGLSDQLTGAVTTTSRYFDDFAVSTIPAEAVVMNSSRSVEIRHDSAQAQSAGGATYSDLFYRGGRFRLKPAGDSDLTTRVAVRVARVDLETGADTGNFTDDIQMTVTYTPKFYAVPPGSPELLQALALA